MKPSAVSSASSITFAAFFIYLFLRLNVVGLRTGGRIPSLFFLERLDGSQCQKLNVKLSRNTIVALYARLMVGYKKEYSFLSVK